MSWYVLPWWSVKGELSADNRKVVKHAKENVRYSRGMGALGSCGMGVTACAFASVETVGTG